MITEPVAIKIESDSELGRALHEWGSAVLLDFEGVRYRISRDHVLDEEDDEVDEPLPEPADPYSILRLVGIGSSGEPSDIARFKDQYIADAVMHRAE